MTTETIRNHRNFIFQNNQLTLSKIDCIFLSQNTQGSRGQHK